MDEWLVWERGAAPPLISGASEWRVVRARRLLVVVLLRWLGGAEQCCRDRRSYARNWHALCGFEREAGPTAVAGFWLGRSAAIRIDRVNNTLPNE